LYKLSVVVIDENADGVNNNVDNNSNLIQEDPAGNDFN